MDYISHHGVKGMKWGIRRYQNEDGTLTSEGRNRYKDGPYSNHKKNEAQLKEYAKARVKATGSVRKAVRAEKWHAVATFLEDLHDYNTAYDTWQSAKHSESVFGRALAKSYEQYSLDVLNEHVDNSMANIDAIRKYGNKKRH